MTLQQFAVLFLFTFSSFQLFGNCPDPNQFGPGMAPAPEDFPCAERNTYFEHDISFYNIAAFQPMGFPQGFPVNSTTIDDITNLPCGLEWETDRPDNTFLAGEQGCITIFGTTNDATGLYEIQIQASVEVDGGAMFPVPLPPFEIELGQIQPEFSYYLRAKSSGENCPVPSTSASIACQIIDVPVLEPEGVCVDGGSIEITFATSFNFDATNVFTAEFSDENGDFSSPTIIGSTASTVPTVILAGIPAGLDTDGNYHIRVVSSAPVITGFESEFPLEIYPLPNQPEITQDQMILTSSSMFGNQWYFNGEPLEGETGQLLEATDFGEYTVMVTDENSCSSEMSEPFMLLSNFTEQLSENTQALNFFPNPTEGAFKITFEHQSGIGDLFIYDQKGRIVKSETGLEMQVQRKVIDLSEMPKGIYTVKLVHEENIFTSRLLLK